MVDAAAAVRMAWKPRLSRVGAKGTAGAGGFAVVDAVRDLREAAGWEVVAIVPTAVLLKGLGVGVTVGDDGGGVGEVVEDAWGTSGDDEVVEGGSTAIVDMPGVYVSATKHHF